MFGCGAQGPNVPEVPSKVRLSVQIFVINLNERFHVKHTFHLELASLFLSYSLFLSQSVNDTCVAAPKPKITFDLKQLILIFCPLLLQLLFLVY